MELTKLESQIVKQLERFGSLNNKEIAESLGKDTGYISKKMKQLVLSQVVKKERISRGKRTFNYYSLVDDDIDKTQLERGLDTTCKEKVSISSGDEYDTDHINLRRTELPSPSVHTSGIPEYYSSQVAQFKETQLVLDVDRTIAYVLNYLSEESESRILTSKEKRLVRILSEENKNYTWILDCIILFLSVALKAETKDE